MKAVLVVICLTVLAACSTSPTRNDPVFKNLHKYINKGVIDD